jgi:hypothetical protein
MSQISILMNQKLRVNIIKSFNVISYWLKQILEAKGEESKNLIYDLEVLDINYLND